MPKRSTWRGAQLDTLRLRLVRLVTRVVALKTRVTLHLPSARPDQAILRLALERMLALGLLSAGASAPTEPSDPQPASRAIRSQGPDPNPAPVTRTHPNPQANPAKRNQPATGLVNFPG